MTKGINQKLKMLYLKDIFEKETDDNHCLSLSEIMEKLKARGVNADRKTLYADFQELRNYGLDILNSNSGRGCVYHLGNRNFELPELKLLVDSVQAARFISDSKSRELIEKLGRLISHDQADSLKRQVVLAGRVKTMNRSVYLTVDKLHQAINQKIQVRFHYMKWDTRKNLVPRNGGNWFQVSPWLMILSDENYYLAAYYVETHEIRHYRVDKIKDLQLLPDQPLQGHPEFRKLDIARYADTHFGMFNGVKVNVQFKIANDKVGIFIDRFGKDIMLIPAGPGAVTTTIPVEVSDQFLGWIMALGEGVEITGPEEVRKQMLQAGQRLVEEYR
jgi:predicted DNA-binding transcriptional regulator YafY